MKIVYYIARNHIPLKKLPSLVQLAKELHTPDISENSFSYSNEIAGNDMLAALSEVISEKIWDELLKVEFFGVIIDESTDITTTKHLSVYVTYVTNIGIIQTKFLQLIELSCGDADTISSLLINLFEKKGKFLLNFYVYT
jgi:hypothetical protein